MIKCLSFEDTIHYFSGNYSPEYRPSTLIEVTSSIGKETLLKKVNPKYSLLVFFLLEGAVDMIDTRGYLYKTFQDGTYFGHTEILDQTTRTSTAKVHENGTYMLIIKRKEYLDLLELYPDVKNEMILCAEKRKLAKDKLVTQAVRFNFRLGKLQYIYIYIL